MTIIPEGPPVVVPVYNSGSCLSLLVEQLARVLGTTGQCYELFLVDDGGRDNSWSNVQQLVSHCLWVRSIRMMRNYGQHNALLAGVRAASFAIIVTMDDDLQHLFEELPQLLECSDELDARMHFRTTGIPPLAIGDSVEVNRTQ